MASDKLFKEATELLTKAVNYESKKNKNDALPMYINGVAKLIAYINLLPESDSRKPVFRERLHAYIERAEAIKGEIKPSVVSMEQRRIEADSTGHSYAKVFGKCIDNKLTSVCVQDPYIQVHHQLHNFVKFCEMVVAGAKELRYISLTTGEQSKSNQTHFDELASSLERVGVYLHVNYSKSVHDREIRFDNGWLVKIGRGLDYFKRPTGSGQYVLGAHDMDFRPCHETIVDIIRIKKI